MAERRSGTALSRAVLRTQPDARLVALTREGHDVAYEEIVRRYRPRLVRQAAAIVSEHRAEDVVQDSLARALAALRAGGADIALAAWLATIVRNRSLNELRDAPPPHEQLDDQYDGVPQPPQVAARKQQVRDVVLAISSLPAQQRRALIGRELEGMSHDQIAAELGVSAGAARGLIFRARAGLRDALGALMPLPALRFLMDAGAPEATGGAAVAAGAAAGAGGGTKAAVGVLAVLATVGSGVAIERNLSNRDPGPRDQAQASIRPGSDGRDSSPAGGGGPDPSAPTRERSGGSGEGSSPPEGDRGEGESGGGGSGGGNSGPGGGGGGSGGSGGGHGPEDDGDHSGPGGGPEAADDDNSGPGGGGDEPDEPEEPEDARSSGPGSGGSEHEDRSGPGGGGHDEPDEPEEDG